MRTIQTAIAVACSVLLIETGIAQQRSGVRVEGTLVDRYTGEALPSAALTVGSAKLTTDDVGRFVVESSPAGAKLTVTVPGGRVIFRNPRAALEVKDAYGYVDNPVYADWASVQVNPQGGEAQDLGVIYADGGPQFADARFSRVCDGQRMTKAPIQTLFFMKNRRENTPWNHQPILTDNISREFGVVLSSGQGESAQARTGVAQNQLPRGILCVNATEDTVGTYTGGGLAYQKTWSVTLVRFPDGKTFKKTLATSPPRQIRGQPFQAGSTDPFPILILWLKTVR